MLDIPTPQLRQNGKPFTRRMLNRSSRRFYNRTLLGLKIPGKYYFWTFTTTPETKKPVGEYWRTLWKWFQRETDGVCSCYAITDEGKGRGVIHLVLRLAPGKKRVSVVRARAMWKKLTGASQIVVRYVPESKKEDLAAYLADQRKCRKIAGEMAWQDEIVRWRWTTGWLPKGFTRAFGRVWHRYNETLGDSLPWASDAVIVDWLKRCHQDPDMVNHPPVITRGIP